MFQQGHAPTTPRDSLRESSDRAFGYYPDPRRRVRRNALDVGLGRIQVRAQSVPEESGLPQRSIASLGSVIPDMPFSSYFSPAHSAMWPPATRASFMFPRDHDGWPMPGHLHPGSEKTKVGTCLNYGPRYVGKKTGPLSSPGSPLNITLHTRQNVDSTVQSILGDPNLGLTATSRVILLHLAQHPSGARIEEIAFSTGSKYRWVESQVSRLTQLNILRRVTPGMYAINTDREVGQ
jgi:hypothetical protein